MGRKRTPGLWCKDGIWQIDKCVLGQRIRGSCGTGSIEEAELILARKTEETRQAHVFGTRPARTFRDAAAKYLRDNMHLSSIADTALHLRQMDPFIGDLPLKSVHIGTLQPFITHRRKKVKTKTINLALSVVRRILNLAARLWRDENGLTWLDTPPLIQMLPIIDGRKPYPLSWDEQRVLFQALPVHLARMCLFSVNTGCRQQEVCGLRWDWEINKDVFIVPGEQVKNREDRLIVLNNVAKSVIEEARGLHPEYVFTFRGHRITRINNNAWRRARREVDIPVRVHDLKHTFGRRLRAAGVSKETRQVLLGHKNGDITTHYSAVELEELTIAVGKICGSNPHKSPNLEILKQKKAAARTA